MDAHIVSEDDFLERIAAKFPNTHPFLILGRGDDCAEIACPPQMAVSTDLFVEDVHFRASYFTPFEIGYKALAVNISDIAAAGAKPQGVSIGLVAPVPFDRNMAEDLIDGMAKAAKDFDIALTGGDLSRGEKLTVCVTIWGGPAKNPPGETLPPYPNFSAKTPPGNPVFLRRGPVETGDVLFLCGKIGLARAGLLLLEEHGREAAERFPACVNAHLMPVPLVDAGLALAAFPSCRLMDVSDGLMRDLPRMLKAYGACCGADIDILEKYIHPEVVDYARTIGQDPALFAFMGGEDYALLGACREKDFFAISKAFDDAPTAIRCLRIGTVTERPGIILNGEAVPPKGFDHFSPSK